MKKAQRANGDGGSVDALGLPPPKGSLQALLKADFLVHGTEVIGVVRRKHPTIYLKLVADLLPLELGLAAAELESISDEELLKIIRALRARTAGAATTRGRTKPA